MKFASKFVIVSLAVSLAYSGAMSIAGSTASATEAVSGKFANWNSAAAELGFNGGLYQPQSRVGLRQDGPIEVLAFGGGNKSARPYAQTSVTASYGNTNKNFIIDQKWTSTSWAARPTVNPARRLVGKAKVRLDSGVQIPVVVYANCNINVIDTTNPPRKKCLKRDVLAYGGSVELQVPPAGSANSNGRNDVVIRSKGLSYADLLKVVSGLKRVT